VIILATTHKATGFVLTLHQGFATVVILYSATLALWGLALYLRASQPTPNYLGALVINEGVVVLQGLIGLGLLIEGHRPADALHYLYGVVAVFTLPIAYTMSERGTTRRDSGVFALATFLMAGIAIRGIATG
jgi:hypothetical protein